MTVITAPPSTVVADPAQRVAADAVLGSDISRASSVEEALQIAGLDWGIRTVSGDQGLSVIDGATEISAFAPGRKLLLRDDSPVVLGMVGHAYKELPNREAFALADEAKKMGAVFASAGESDYGRRAYLTMNLPEATVQIGGKDVVTWQVRYRTDHAGTGAIIGDIRGRRMWCLNGCSVTTKLPIRWVVRHTSSADERLALAEHTLRGGLQYAKEFAALGERLISSPMPMPQYLRYIDTLWPKPDADRKAALTRWEKRRGDLVGLYRTSALQQDAPQTAWSAAAAVTEFEQWFSPARSAETRARRQFDGRSDEFTTRAFDLVREMAGV